MSVTNAKIGNPMLKGARGVVEWIVWRFIVYNSLKKYSSIRQQGRWKASTIYRRILGHDAGGQTDKSAKSSHQNLCAGIDNSEGSGEENEEVFIHSTKNLPDM